MDKNQIMESFWKELYSVFEKEAGQISNETIMRDDLNATSSHYFALIASIEELTGESVPYSKIKACKTIDDLLEFLEGVIDGA